MGSMGTLLTDTPRPVDASAFDLRFSAARDRLVRICAGLVGADAADDVVHDAYLRARLRHGQLRDDDRFEAWLTRIAIHLCMNRHRSHRRWIERSRRCSGWCPQEARRSQHTCRRASISFSEQHLLGPVQLTFSRAHGGHRHQKRLSARRAKGSSRAGPRRDQDGKIGPRLCVPTRDVAHRADALEGC